MNYDEIPAFAGMPVVLAGMTTNIVANFCLLGR
jgi:hypothetical protein